MYGIDLSFAVEISSTLIFFVFLAVDPAMKADLINTFSLFGSYKSSAELMDDCNAGLIRIPRTVDNFPPNHSITLHTATTATHVAELRMNFASHLTVAQFTALIQIHPHFAPLSAAAGFKGAICLVKQGNPTIFTITLMRP
jgi:hypothetical protein